MEGFLRYRFGGLIYGGAYFRNFTVSINLQLLLEATSTTRLTLCMRHGYGLIREALYLTVTFSTCSTSFP